MEGTREGTHYRVGNRVHGSRSASKAGTSEAVAAVVEVEAVRPAVTAGPPGAAAVQEAATIAGDPASAIVPVMEAIAVAQIEPEVGTYHEARVPQAEAQWVAVLVAVTVAPAPVLPAVVDHPA
jgi:hypothetical protein